MTNHNGEIPSDLITLVYSDLARPGVKQVGIALGTILSVINVPLLPLKAWSEKANVVFINNMEKYRERLKDTSEVEVSAVPPEIGVPIIESLGYTMDEDLSDLFVELLAKAAFNKEGEEAHPSFIATIKNLSPDEAKVIQWLA